MTLRPVIAVLAMVCSLPAFAADISEFRVWTDPDKTRAVLDLSSHAKYQLFTLKNPDRVVIDLDNSVLSDDLKFKPEHAGVIKSVRHGKPDASTLRVVLDLNSSSKIKSFLLDPTGQYGYRLVVDLYSGENGAAASSVKHASDLQKTERDIVVAIDAGHGGEDPGAVGKKHTREKDVVLAISRKLRDAIDAEPGMKAVLIRDGDYYIALRDRFEKARKHRADLFVSIHADAFKSPKVSGSSVFVLSQRGASSEFARRMADSENSSDQIGGVKLSETDDMLASVLLDLSQSATMEASNEVAKNIFGSLDQLGKTHKNHVERANFLVLKSPDVPSVLIETAFISNPAEEKRLKDPTYQKRLAQTISVGIRDYFYMNSPPGTWIAANKAPVRHLVSRGDTLGGIANRYRVSLYSLRRINNISGDTIHVGRELLIPAT
jgi:N-acetylmuramoyl-L-alanine amidase